MNEWSRMLEIEGAEGLTGSLIFNYFFPDLLAAWKAVL